MKLPRLRRLLLTACALGITAPAIGCNAYRLKPPTGFAEVSSGTHSARMIASDNVGLSVQAVPNVRGGTLAFWSEDLVRKLGVRGYTLVGQTPTKSKNGVNGTRFDFSYENPDGEAKFFSVLLFATNKNLLTVQVAGDAAHRDRYLSQLDRIARATKVKGCRLGEKICRGAQPGPLKTAPPENKTETPDQDKRTPAPTKQDDALAEGDASSKDG